MVREMYPKDSKKILEIYGMGLITRNATFETNIPTWEEWNSKHLKHSRFVYIENEEVLGWIALSPVSSRKVYSGVAEISVYVDTKFSGRGIGSKLMEEAISSSELNGIWTLHASVFPENQATVRLHKNYGFRMIGTREKIAQLDGIWRDTILLERRSKRIGIESSNKNLV